MVEVCVEPWERMVAHAEATYPNECCGVMLGSADETGKSVTVAIPLENASVGPQQARYELRPEDLLRSRPRGAPP